MGLRERTQCLKIGSNAAMLRRSTLQQTQLCFDLEDAKLKKETLSSCITLFRLKTSDYKGNSCAY